MKPEEPKSSQGGVSLSQQGHQVSAPTGQPTTHTSKEAAAQLIRSQIDSIYNIQPGQQDSSPEPIADPIPLEDLDPYKRTHSEKPDLQTNDWGKYHSAWQNYYQKYYEGYYLAQAHKLYNDYNGKAYLHMIFYKKDTKFFKVKKLKGGGG